MKNTSLLLRTTRRLVGAILAATLIMLPLAGWAADSSELRKKANAGNAAAQRELGNLYYSGRGVKVNYVEAAKWFQRAAEQGDAEAQNNLGSMYYNGEGVGRKDDVEAFKWYRKAARQGDADAEFNLGNMYSWGHGVAQDKKEGMKWTRKAAEQGDPLAQANMGSKYLLGDDGVSQNYVLAHMWFDLARAHGMDRAKLLMEYLLPLMTKEQIAEAQRLATEWQEKHSGGGE